MPFSHPTLQHMTSRVRHLLSYLLMSALAVLFLYPTYNMVRTSLLQSGPLGPKISLQNYAELFEYIPFERYFANSLIITLTTIALGLVVNSLLAYLMARARWRWRFLTLGAIVALMVIPFEALVIPLLLLTNTLGWLDSYHVQIIPFIADPLSVFLFYQFFVDFSKELEDAARVDGLGRLRVYLQVVVPNSRPAFAAVAIFRFLFLWDSYLWPVMVTRGPEFRPLTVGMRHAFEFGHLTAYATLMTIPTVVLFLALQRRFTTSLAAQV